MDSAANRRSLVSRRFPRRPCALGRRLLGRPSCRLTAPAAKEQARLRAHFREVLAELRARDVSHLPGPQQDARSRLLDELARYARVGRFPKNLDFPGARMPYFIDAFGTRCAVACLVESTGETALVARVAATMNNALVRELEADPELRWWLEQAGLTAAEAARIQPSYCFMTKAEGCLCNQAFQISAVVEATLTTPLMAGEVTVRIDVVHGDMTIAMPGQEVMLYISTAAVGDVVLIGVGKNWNGVTTYNYLRRLNPDGTLEDNCNLNVPSLTKKDAIDALLAGGSVMNGPEVCSNHLAALDARWSESICENKDGGDEGGCAIAPPAGVSPFILGTMLALAAVWSRRALRGSLRSKLRHAGRPYTAHASCRPEN